MKHVTLLLLFSRLVFGAWSFPLASTDKFASSAGTATSVSVLLNNAPAAGNTLILHYNVTGTAPNVSSITYTGCTWLQVDQDNGTARVAEIWIGYNCTGSGGTTLTVNFASTSNSVRIEVAEGSGGATTTPIDVHSGAATTSSGTTLVTGSVTPTQSTDLCTATGVRDNGSGNAGAPSGGWTALVAPGNNGVNAAAFKIPGSTSAQQTSWVYTTISSGPAAVVGCYKAAAGGGSTTLMPPVVMEAQR